MYGIAVASSFSKAARNYEANARVQARVGRELLSLSPHIAPKTILELGCGTGLYTRMLLDAFPEARIVAIDISDAMVQAAAEHIDTPRASFLCADAESFATGKYDLITSNASFHWFRDPTRTLENVRGMLDKNGLLTFSYFGPHTYHELHESLEHATGSHPRLACSDFLTPTQIGDLLGGVFRDYSVVENDYHEDFDSLRDLLDNIRLTGTRGAGCSRIAWTRGLLRRLEETYLARFGRIRATYQVYLCRARI